MASLVENGVVIVSPGDAAIILLATLNNEGHIYSSLGDNESALVCLNSIHDVLQRVNDRRLNHFKLTAVLFPTLANLASSPAA